MFWMFLGLIVICAFIYGALRIIGGWILPESTIRSIDRGVMAIGSGSAKLFVVVVGLFFLAALVYGAFH